MFSPLDLRLFLHPGTTSCLRPPPGATKSAPDLPFPTQHCASLNAPPGVTVKRSHFSVFPPAFLPFNAIHPFFSPARVSVRPSSFLLLSPPRRPAPPFFHPFVSGKITRGGCAPLKPLFPQGYSLRACWDFPICQVDLPLFSSHAILPDPFPGTYHRRRRGHLFFLFCNPLRKSSQSFCHEGASITNDPPCRSSCLAR